MIHDRATAIELAEKMVKAAPTYIHYQIGYAEGLLVGWMQAGWITDGECKRYRRLIQTAKPAWWNLLGHILRPRS